jgi:CubicO group peptidase (beta-lactamase class C family)
MNFRAFVFLTVLSFVVQQTAKADDVFKTVSPESVGLNAEKLAEIDMLMQTEVDAGRIAGCLALVARGEKVAYVKTWGHQDREKKTPMKQDTIFRIYSMSKPITSSAVMQLVEQGKIHLDDPVSKYLSALKDVKVLVGKGDDAKSEPAKREITVRDLLRHTSGLTYGFFGNTPVDQAYRRARILSGATIEETVTKLGKLPLLYQPGTRWHYSVSTDVLGRLVEVVSEERFDRYLAAHIFKPLGMRDTFFTLPPDRLPRLAQMYTADGPDALKPSSPLESFRFVTQPNRFYSGGGGLCSTTRNYLRFCQALLNEGELEGKRILKSETIKEMTSDHLKEIPSGGFKFGLGFAIGTEGEYSWGGAAGTRFWINPKRKLIGIHMIQIKPYGRKYGDQMKRLVIAADTESR